MGAGFARATIDPFTGYDVFNLLGSTYSIEEFIETLREECSVLGINNPKINFAESAKDSPFIYELNDQKTREVFPKMPHTPLAKGISESLRYFLKQEEE